MGPAALDWDLLARRARLKDTARRCFNALAPETRRWLRSYADGVNTGLRRSTAGAPQFTAAGVAPGTWRPWTPLALWLSTHLLMGGFPSKLWRGELAERLGPEAVGLFSGDGPGSGGSNGWLLPGDRTRSGAAILAGDPHRIVLAPGVYQQLHVACPEFDVVGLAIPGVPGIAHFGHTGRVAWAITNAMADYQDLYHERLRRRGRGVEALGPDGWRPAKAVTDVVHVSGAAPVEFEAIETERGPVVLGGYDAGWAMSLRRPVTACAALGFDSLPQLLRATSVADVDAAFEGWVEPVNVVMAADTRGGLLHRVAGRVPVRAETNRLWPVPGWEPGHGWTGSWEAPPREPVSGTAVMANQRDLAAPLGVEFAAGHRAARIRELLGGSGNWSAGDMAAIHTDDALPSASALLDPLARLDGLSPAAARLQRRLLRWDRRMDAGNTDATAYALLRAAAVARLAAHPLLAALAAPSSRPALYQPWLAPEPRIALALGNLLSAGGALGIDAADVVRAAAEDAASPAETAAPWGHVHRLSPWSALPSLCESDWPGLSGDHDCVLSVVNVPDAVGRVTRGPVARYVWDLARREDSLWIVPLGASGDPSAPHGRDQLPLWARGELLPVVTDRSELTADSSPARSPSAAESPRP